jgi:chitodextrinase
VTSGTSSASPKSLVTIDRNSGAGTLRAALNPAVEVGDISFDPDGQLFGFAQSGASGQLYRIDKVTGAMTAVGPPIPGAGGTGLAFCGNVLFLASDGPTGDLRELDPATGAAQLVHVLGTPPQATGVYDALACRLDGHLFGSNHVEPPATNLVRIDRFSASITNSGVTLPSLDAIAYDGVWEGGARAVPSAVVTGEPVAFTGIRGSGPVTVDWNFGDGDSGSGLGATHSYATTGTYTATFNASSVGSTNISGSLNIVVVDPAAPGRRQILWGVDGAGGGCTNPSGCGAEAWLYRIDTANGAGTPVGKVGYGVSSIAADPVDGVLYGVTGWASWRGPVLALIRIDKQTGAGTLVGRLTQESVNKPFPAVPDMAFDANGQLWAWNENSDDLFRVDKATGAMTLVADSMHSTAGSGITFNLAGTLFGVLDQNNGELSTINTTTGLTTLGPVLTGAPGPTGQEVPALSTSATGLIYGVSWDESTKFIRDTYLFTIATDTSVVTPIGRTISFLDAIEFEPVSAPQIAGAPVIAPNPALVGETVSFTANATSSGGLPLAYGWTFGDGAAANGNPAMHAYAAPGSFAVALTVDDGNADPVTQPASAVVAKPLMLTRALVALNFKKSGKDVITAKGKLDLPSGAAAGQAFSIDVSGAAASGTLSAKGKSKALTIKKSGAFRLALKKGDFAGALADEGLGNESVKNKPVNLQVLIVVGSDAFGTLRGARYSAKQGKSGRAR